MYCKSQSLSQIQSKLLIIIIIVCITYFQVLKLKSLVKKCLSRHIISPSNRLSDERPFALVAWGKSIEIPFIDVNMLVAFIRMNALQGPERIATDGLYDFMLTDAAVAVSLNDNALCPNM